MIATTLSDAKENNGVEILQIKNFCGIQSLEVQLKAVMVLIGQQSTGKSIISKLIYWARQTMNLTLYDIQNGGTYRNVVKEAQERFSEHFVFEDESHFSINYSVGNFKISVELSSRKTLKITFCKQFVDLIDFMVKTHRNNNALEEGHLQSTRKRREEMNLYSELIHTMTGDETTTKPPIYVPAARSFFSQIEDSLFVFLSSSKRLDPVIESFGDTLRWAKSSFTRQTRHPNNFLQKIFKETLKGTYIRDKNEEYIKHNDGRRVPVSAASSGQQEILPLCLILGDMASSPSSSTRLLIIEEPEAHLHPGAQKVIVEAIVHAGNIAASPIIITTHSPYVLSIINNLILTGKVAAEKADDYFNSDLASSLTFGTGIHPLDVTAYCMDKGTARSLIDEETGLIDADVIDSVSNDLSENFDNLLSILY